MPATTDDHARYVPCQNCGSARVELRGHPPGWRPKPKQSYYFTNWFFCLDCARQYNLESCKQVIQKPGSPKPTPTKPKKRAPKRRYTPKEENLTVEEVLEKYTGGPDSGVFTDGSCHPNPGRGGWGVVWVESGEIVAQNHGQDPQTTNNRMELQALIEAYRLLPEDAKVTVYCDNQYCVQAITVWAPNWEKKGWKRKEPYKNLDLVQELLALYRAHPGCELVWVPAHSGDRWNEYADSLSTAWMRESL